MKAKGEKREGRDEKPWKSEKRKKSRVTPGSFRKSRI
jgi:hypothetical protein